MDVDATKEMDVLGLSGLFFSFAAVATITDLYSPETDADVAVDAQTDYLVDYLEEMAADAVAETVEYYFL